MNFSAIHSEIMEKFNFNYVPGLKTQVFAYSGQPWREKFQLPDG